MISLELNQFLCVNDRMQLEIKSFKGSILKAAASSFAFLLTTSLLFADVAIYSYKGTASSIGNGGMQPIKMSGYFVIDLDSGPPNVGASVGSTIIGSSAGFSEVPLRASVMAPVFGPGGKSYTIIADAESPLEAPSGSTATQLKYESAFGVNSLVQVRSGGPFKSLPKSMSSPFMVIGKDVGGLYYLQRGQLTYKFEASASQWANSNNHSLAFLIQFARNIYIEAGLPEW